MHMASSAAATSRHRCWQPSHTGLPGGLGAGCSSKSAVMAQNYMSELPRVPLAPWRAHHLATVPQLQQTGVPEPACPTVSMSCCSGAGVLHRGRLRDLPGGPPRTLCGGGKHRLAHPAAGAAHAQPAGTRISTKGHLPTKVACRQPPACALPQHGGDACVGSRCARQCSAWGLLSQTPGGQVLSALPLVHKEGGGLCRFSLRQQRCSSLWGSEVV